MWEQPPPPPPRPYGLYPAPPPPPPPPPPPRKPASSHAPASNCSHQDPLTTSHSSRRVSSVDGGSELSDRPSSNPAPDISYQQEVVSIVQASGLTGEVADVMQRLESKMMFELGRVELEAQAAHRALAADLARWRKEREAAWKHVGELKEQSRLLRQRNYELEVQNGHLHRHIMLLQDQMGGMADQRAQYETAVRMAAGQQAQVQGALVEAARNQALLHQLGMSLTANPPAAPAPVSNIADPGSTVSAASLASALASVTLPGGVHRPASHDGHTLGLGVPAPGIIGDKKVPRVPHTGADIW